MRFAARDGAVLHVDEHGVADGPVLIVVPGGPGRHPDYLGTFEPIAGSRRVIVLHPRGVGGSEAAPPRTFADAADDIEDLRRHLDADTVDVLAHASGCRTALVYAARSPERVAHLLLIAPATAWLGIADDDRATIARRHASQPWFEAALDAAVDLAGEADPHRRVALYPRAAPLAWSTWDARAHAFESAAVWYPEAVVGFPVSSGAEKLLAALPRITCPVVIVGGEDDPFVGFQPLAVLTDLFPRGSLAAIEDCGHYPWIEAPAEFAIALRAFLAPVPSNPPTGRRPTASRPG